MPYNFGKATVVPIINKHDEGNELWPRFDVQDAYLPRAVIEYKREQTLSRSTTLRWLNSVDTLLTLSKLDLNSMVPICKSSFDSL